MSECFFEFTITCPNCNHIRKLADGYETDDWVEVFVFSGYSAKNAQSYYNPNYTCPDCSFQIDIDQLYRQKNVKFDSIEKIKAYLKRNQDYVIEQGSLGDHGWEPDLDAVFRRLQLLYPGDTELQELQTLYYHAFHNKKFFTKYEPAYGVKVVHADSVKYKKFLTKIYLPDSVTEIGDRAFTGSKITDLFIPEKVKFIGTEAFKDCIYLTSVHSSDSLIEIGDEAFARTKIKRFFFPNGIKKIGKNSFYGTQLTEIFIPSSCEEIGEGAFCNCKDLKKITLPAHIRNVKDVFEPTADIFFLTDSEN